MFGFKKKETFLYEKLDGFARLTRYAGSEPEVTVAQEYEGLPVTEIAENAFYDASKAEVINIPSSVKRVLTNAFRGCKSLKRVNLPSALEELGDYAFSGCKALESAELPARLKALPEGLFSKCSALKEFRVPAGITKVGEECFSGCTALESVDLGTTVTEIGPNAFKNCSKKLSVVLPAEIEIRDEELLENADMIYRRGKNGLALLKYGGHDTVIEIPDAIGGENIVAIGPRVFSMFAYLERIKLPARLTYIGEQAFAGCSGLTGIEFPETLEYIGKSAFTACGPRVNRPGYMARKASSDDEDGGIPAVTIPASVKVIEDMAFAGCSALKSVTFTKGSVKIGGACFLGCPIESIVIPEGITEIQAEMFRGCSHLKSVSLPSTLDSIWQRAFVDCEALESITLPDKLEVIAEGAFMGCSGLRTLTIPARVREIEPEAFAFNGFEEGGLTVAPGNRNYEMINGCLIGKKSGRLITSCLAEGAVLTVPGSASEICSLAFAGSPIAELTVPAFVTKIEQWALRGSMIKKLTVENPNCEIGNGILLETGDVDVQPDGSPAVEKLLETANRE